MNVLTQIFFSNAYAQAQGMADKPAFWQSLMPILIIFVIFYFLMIRPQKKRMDQEQAFLASLSKGDEIFTKTGIIGVITGLTDRIVTIEVADGVRIKVLRGQVGGLVSKLFEEGDKAKSSKKK